MNNQAALRPAPSRNFHYATLSHKGWVRKNNEDRLGASEFITGVPAKGPVLLAVLCDGVGGNPGGEVAAQISVETVVQSVAGCKSLAEPEKVLERAVIQANQAVLRAQESQALFRGMASTCIAALVTERRLYLANLGDSRAYLLRNGKIFQLSYDHTWLEESAGIEIGGIAEITRENPLAHVLSRYLGSPHPVDVDLRIRTIYGEGNSDSPGTRMEIKTGDTLLLCSDGLTDLLNNNDILNCLTGDDPRKDAQRLVLGALGKGGHDNTSVIVVHLSP